MVLDRLIKSAEMEQGIETGKADTSSTMLTVVGWLAIMIFAFHACTHMVGGGDTWVAIACGRHFFNYGVNTPEPFSTRSVKSGPTREQIEAWPKPVQWIADKLDLEMVRYWHPTGWVKQDWLAHVIFYWLSHKSPFADAETLSFNSLVYWKFAVYILTVICVYYTGRLLGAAPALCAVFACFSMFVGRSFFDIRPAAFTNLFVAVFLLVLVLSAYRNILYIWLIVPVVVFWCNLHGGYIYVFIMLVPFTVLNLVTSFFPKRFVSVGRKGIYHTIAAGVAAFLAMILFNPSHLANVTHIFAIFFGKHAEQWLSPLEWHPAFEWKNRLGTAVPFLIMLILACVVLLIWFVAVILAAVYSSRGSKEREDSPDQYQLCRINIAVMVIAALTICMAIRSRRFIPIAAFATCPIMAALVDQVICAISAGMNLHKRDHFAVPLMPRSLKFLFAFVGAAAVLAFGVWWGLKLKYVYLDPWPRDPQFTSVFMRMTASYPKPFGACAFIRDNKLEGEMFNYWTDGGFIAWGQQADTNTGRIPLKLFIDSRAQRAYELNNFELWSKISAGGPTAQIARREKRELTTSDYTQIARWVDEKLKKENVWVVLMPSSRFHTPLVRGLERNPDWRLVFFNNKQKLFVDTTTARGRELFDGILAGKTLYPDDFSKNLTIAHILFGRGRGSEEQALDFAIKAFEQNPSRAPMQEILSAAKSSRLRARIGDLCRVYFQQFSENKARYAEEDGYYHRLMAALMAGNYLKKLAEKEKNATDAKSYASKVQEYRNELKETTGSKMW